MNPCIRQITRTVLMAVPDETCPTLVSPGQNPNFVLRINDTWEDGKIDTSDKNELAEQVFQGPEVIQHCIRY